MSELRDILIEKYVLESTVMKLPYPELKYPCHMIQNENIIISWFSVPAPFVMEPGTFRHDFDQVVYFSGGDPEHMDVLGGVAEFYLGDERGDMEKFIITKPTSFYIKAGTYHCPIIFKEVFDPEKPMRFEDIVLAGVYRKYLPGSDQPLGIFGTPIEKTW